MSSAKETFFGGSVGEVKNFCIKPFRHNLFRNNYFRPNPQLYYTWHNLVLIAYSVHVPDNTQFWFLLLLLWVPLYHWMDGRSSQRERTCAHCHYRMHKYCGTCVRTMATSASHFPFPIFHGQLHYIRCHAMPILCCAIVRIPRLYVFPCSLTSEEQTARYFVTTTIVITVNIH